MCNRTVISDYKAYYPDPISVSEGDILTLGKQDNWEGHIWIWAIASNSKEGWVPDNLCSTINDETVANYNYSAVELTCKVGDKVKVLLEDHGWAWCSNEDNEKGWIPLRNLSGNVLEQTTP